MNLLRIFVASILALLALEIPAVAQGCGPANPNCIVPTAPVGTSNNQAASTQFVQQNIGCVHSFDYATGNGSTDDTTALGNWITQAQTIGCGYLDTGTYKISSVLTVSASLTIYGNGINSIIVPSSTTQNAFSITTTSAVNFYNFWIQPSGTQTAGACILVQPSSSENSGSHFENMVFSKCWNGIDFERASQWFVAHNTFVNFISLGINVANSNAGDSGDSVIVANNFQNASAGSSTGINQVSSGGLKIVGNKINVVNIGYELNVASGVSSSITNITGNSIEGCVTGCIILTTQAPTAAQWRAVQIVGNELMCLATTCRGIWIAAASTPTWLLGVTIDANSILLNTTGSGGACALIDYSTGVIVSHNYCENVPGAAAAVGLSFTANASVPQAASNTFRGFAAGTTIQSASTTLMVDDMTGILTANLLTSAANGSRMFATDADPASRPCTHAGAQSGSTAFRQNGQWLCF
jgi:hypothetical protein